jgi:hypothetical protein
VLGLGRWGDHDGRAGWSAVLVALSMVGSLDGEVAHLPFDHAGVAAVSSLDVDFVGYLAEEELVVIFMVGEGEKTPASISWTG